MIRIRMIDHIVLRTDNTADMVHFYTDVLGCKLERTLPAATGLIQLRAGKSLIDIVDVDSELGRPGGGPPTVTENNLDHFCVQIEALDQRQLTDWLVTKGVEASEFEARYGAEGFGPSIYIHDPDGNTVELRNELRVKTDM